MIELFKCDCFEGLKKIPDESVQVVCTDPPYLYLKNQKLDRKFDEHSFFRECKRILKKDGFIVLFGRGTSFYRWNNELSYLGFKFKEEIIWNKSYSSSPLLPISRIHETISIHTPKNGILKRTKVPYLEIKKYDIDSIIGDVNRLRNILKNFESLDAVKNFLEKNIVQFKNAKYKARVTDAGDHGTIDRAVAVAKGIKDGLNERTIIRTDYRAPNFPRKGITAEAMKPSGDRNVNVVQGIEFGLNEKSIIKIPRDHYKTIHPTQKPVELIERLLNLMSKPGDMIVDPFAGSFSCAIAAHNLSRNFIGFEIDEEYFNAGKMRINSLQENIF